MCGIVGFNWEDQNLAKRMGKALASRGPDQSSQCIAGGFSLAHQRLSIIDLSVRGRQPMTNEDGSLVLVYNGELYNFKELRKQLEKLGHKFRSDTDSEVIVHAYERWGAGCLSRFNGMFAFAIVDVNAKSLFLARDRLGIKPLYYYWDGQKFVFASEIKAILESGVATGMNRSALDDYLRFKFVPGPQTMFTNIKKLQPGHWLRLSDNKMSTRQWWDLSFSERKMSMNDAVKQAAARIEAGVHRRLMADVPVGVLLSGGLDSSMIAAHMSRAESNINTFSVGFSDAEHNELGHARKVAQFCGAEHHEIMVESSDVLDHMGLVSRHLDEPLGDWAAMPTYMIAKFARKKVKVALAGDGADEVFVGYRQSILNSYCGVLKRIPATLTRALPESSKVRRAVDICKRPSAISRAAGWIEVCNSSWRRTLGVKEASNTVGQYRDKMVGLSALNQNLYFESKTWLPDDLLMKIDKTTMAVGLEARVPFLDHELVEFMACVPSSMKVRGNTTKYIQKKAALSILPKEIVYRKKHGFTLPTHRWFRQDLRAMAQDMFSSDLFSGLISSSGAQKMLDAHVGKKEDFSFQLCSLVSLGSWAQQYQKYL